MEENEEMFFISNTYEPPSHSSKPSSIINAGYIRNWKTEVVCAQLYLSQLQFKDYKEYKKKNNTYKYSPPKFRYKYLKEMIILYLVNNVQIFIPLQVLLIQIMKLTRNQAGTAVGD